VFVLDVLVVETDIVCDERGSVVKALMEAV